MNFIHSVYNHYTSVIKTYDLLCTIIPSGDDEIQIQRTNFSRFLKGEKTNPETFIPFLRLYWVTVTLKYVVRKEVKCEH